MLTLKEQLVNIQIDINTSSWFLKRGNIDLDFHSWGRHRMQLFHEKMLVLSALKKQNKRSWFQRDVELHVVANGKMFRLW